MLYEINKNRINAEKYINFLNKGRGIGNQLMKTALDIAGGEKDIAVYLIANENAIPFL